MAEKLTPIEGMQTNWAGLWYHPEYNGFSSGCIDLSALRKFKGQVRLYVRKNKYYNDGENGRPNYCFCLKDASSPTFTELSIEEDDNKIARLAEIMRQGRDNDAPPGYQSVARCQELMHEAISLIEEITGEKWEFTATTWR